MYLSRLGKETRERFTQYGEQHVHYILWIARRFEKF